MGCPEDFPATSIDSTGVARDFPQGMKQIGWRGQFQNKMSKSVSPTRMLSAWGTYAAFCRVYS
jgi:hypothetical protein